MLDFEKGLTAAESGDYATALRELTPLAKQGDATAQFKLGLMYDNARGVPLNEKTAVKWYTRAAKQGVAPAQYNLGVIYDIGLGDVPQDIKTAVMWYTRAAEQGFAPPQNDLGLMYAIGEGVPQDDVYAYMWFDLAASSGDEEAIENRNFLARWMTPADLSAAQELARECVRKNYKEC